MATAIIIGVGPDQGLGAQLCKRFAAEGLHVLVAGRTKPALDAVVRDIVASGGGATAVVADATNEADIVALFDKAGADLDLAIYNAGNNTPGKIIEMEASYFEQSWRVVCFGGFLFGREAVRRMVPKGAGSLLFTGASASLRGAPATARSIRRRRVCGPGAGDGQGICRRRHSRRRCRRRRPDRRREDHEALPDAAGREERLISIAGIVDGFVFLHKQPRRAWSFELDVRTSQESCERTGDLNW